MSGTGRYRNATGNLSSTSTSRPSSPARPTASATSTPTTQAFEIDAATAWASSTCTDTVHVLIEEKPSNRGAFSFSEPRPSTAFSPDVQRLSSHVEIARDDSLTLDDSFRQGSASRFPQRGADPRGADMQDTSWIAEGKCREQSPEMFFPSDGVGVEIAKRVCAVCPVRSHAWSSPCSTTSNTGFGVGLRAGSGGG